MGRSGSSVFLAAKTGSHPANRECSRKLSGNESFVPWGIVNPVTAELMFSKFNLSWNIDLARRDFSHKAGETSQ
jgi:hypothetical protein